MLYDCRRRTVLRGIVLRHTVQANFFGTIAGGASGLSRIGTLVEGQPDGFIVTVRKKKHPPGLRMWMELTIIIIFNPTIGAGAV